VSTEDFKISAKTVVKNALENQGIDGRIILKCFLRMENVKWIDLDQDTEEWRSFVYTVIKSSCLHRASMIIKHSIIQLMHNI